MTLAVMKTLEYFLYKSEARITLILNGTGLCLLRKSLDQPFLHIRNNFMSLRGRAFMLINFRTGLGYTPTGVIVRG